ncbi:hypothetical protein ABFS83_08G079700 [Erythranthe nasuta]
MPTVAAVTHRYPSPPWEEETAKAAMELVKRNTHASNRALIVDLLRAFKGWLFPDCWKSNQDQDEILEISKEQSIPRMAVGFQYCQNMFGLLAVDIGLTYSFRNPRNGS